MRANGIVVWSRALVASMAIVATGLGGLSGAAGAQTATVVAPTCHDAQLRLALVSGGAGLGHVAIVVQIKNVSGRACSLSGYPKAALRTSSTAKWIAATETQHGYLGGLGHTSQHMTLPIVVLHAHGGVASAMIEGSDVPAGNAKRCSNFRTVNVRLPHTATNAGFYFTFPACVTPQVHPIVAGIYGSAG